MPHMAGKGMYCSPLDTYTIKNVPECARDCVMCVCDMCDLLWPMPWTKYLKASVSLPGWGEGDRQREREREQISFSNSPQLAIIDLEHYLALIVRRVAYEWKCFVTHVLRKTRWNRWQVTGVQSGIRSKCVCVSFPPLQLVMLLGSATLQVIILSLVCVCLSGCVCLWGCKGLS